MAPTPPLLLNRLFVPLACSFSLLVACGPAPSSTGTPSPSTTPSASATSPSTTPPAGEPSASAGFSPKQFAGFSASDAQAIASSLTQTRFAELDTDKDNALNATELQAYLGHLPYALFAGQDFQLQQAGVSSSEALLASYDTNHDGKLSLAETQKLLADLLSKQARFQFANAGSTDCNSSFALLAGTGGRVTSDSVQAFFQSQLGVTLNANALQALNALGILGKTPAQICSGNPQPSPAVTPVPTPTPNATPTPTPIPSSTSTGGDIVPTPNDISVIEKTTLNGKVFDDTFAPLDGVTITARSLTSSVPFEATATTAGGSYAFNNAPSGVTIEITASRAGYTTRRRVEVLKSNKTGDPNANRYDFGTQCAAFVAVADNGCSGSFGQPFNALSDKPEVIQVIPGRNASGVDAKTSVVMKFSEPMDRTTVSDNFELYAFNSKKFTVDTSTNASTVTGSGDVNVLSGTRIWDKAAFDISWNSDDTEATFSFKEERMLPTDRDSAKTPDYQVGLNRGDGAIKDKSGISRGTAEKKFKLTDGDFERSYKFSIKTDEVKPKVDSVVAQTAENSGVNSDGDVVKVRYSERMIHYTLGPTIAGGMGGVASQAAGANNSLTGDQVAPNYKVTVIRQASTLMNQTTWSALGGRAIFDTNDPTHKTVLLLPLRYPNATVNNAYLLNQTFTSAVGSYSTDGNTNNLAGYTFGLVARTTNPGNTSFSVRIGDNLADNNAVASALMTLLNNTANGLGAHAPSTNPFTVTASAATNGTIRVSFNDTSGKYIAFTVTANQTVVGADVLPDLRGGGVTVTNNTSLNVYQPGDNVIVKVDTTILDPAGNSVDSSNDNASANAS